jgi:hypothetical protein
MVHAEYLCGRKYHAATLDDVDFYVFTLGGLKSLRVASFVWRIAEHGVPLYHGMRSHKNTAGSVLWRIYILVTDRCKIFVFSQGDYRVLSDWVPGTQFFERFVPRRWPLHLIGAQ